MIDRREFIKKSMGLALCLAIPTEALNILPNKQGTLTVNDLVDVTNKYFNGIEGIITIHSGAAPKDANHSNNSNCIATIKIRDNQEDRI